MIKQFIYAMIISLVCSIGYSSEIIDNANLFGQNAKQQALVNLKSVQDSTGIETIVETFSTAGQQKFNNDTEKDRFFKDWLKILAEKHDARGIYILICKTPGRIQVDFHKDIFARGIQLGVTSVVRDAGLVHFKQKNFDTGLMAMSNEIKGIFAIKSEVPAVVQIQPPQVIVRNVNQPPQIVTIEDVKVAQDVPMGHGDKIMLWVLAGGFSITLIGIFAVVIYQEKKKNDKVREYNKIGTSKDSVNYDKISYPSYQYTKPQQTASPSVPIVNQVTVHDNGIDPLLAGVVGYELGKATNPTPPPVERTPEPTRKRETRRDDSDDYTPSYTPSSSYDSGSSWSSSSSSDSYSGGSGSDFGSSSSFDSGSSGGFDGGSGGDF